MPDHLVRAGRPVNRKRIQRLMRMMGLEGVFPGKKTTTRSPEHQVYPYLLRGLEVTRGKCESFCHSRKCPLSLLFRGTDHEPGHGLYRVPNAGLIVKPPLQDLDRQLVGEALREL